MPDAAYYRAWREAHPEYKARERERSRSRQRSPEQRRAERERAKEKAAKKRASAKQDAARKRDYYLSHVDQHKESMRRYNAKRKAQDPERERRIRRDSARDSRARQRIEQADRVVAQVLHRDDRTELYDPLYEDALSCALISLIESPNAWGREKAEGRALQDVKDFVRGERRWRWHAQALPDER